MSQFLGAQATWKGPAELAGPIQYLWQKLSQVINHNATAVDASAFASLPASPLVGMIAVITDSPTITWGANITVGAGIHTVLAWYNGTHWTVIGI